MFGSSNPAASQDDMAVDTGSVNEPRTSQDGSNGMEKQTSPTSRKSEDNATSNEKKRRSSGNSKVREMFSSAKNALHSHSSSNSSNNGEKSHQSPIQKLGKTDPALSVPQGSQNNSAGESQPGPRSTFKVGVTEDKNKKCRRTMEDTHAYLYNFLSTPQPILDGKPSDSASTLTDGQSQHVVETDNGYFAIFDGHAGTFAADWCGKKLHLLLEDTIRKNPNTPIPELLDQTFTNVDQQLEKLPLKNSGCTAVIAVLRWEDRVPVAEKKSTTHSSAIAPITAAAARAQAGASVAPVPVTDDHGNEVIPNLLEQPTEKIRQMATRHRVLYTANVGDARIVLCRNGRALRLSYDHKGSDEHEGRRVANAGGLILNNRVNGVLAVTRALGDAYMKDLVTGHPYTTETVVQPDQDEFLILACDGLWDVCTDQEAVDLIRQIQDPQVASKMLVDHALARFSTDNLSCMVIRFDNRALREREREASMGVEGDPPSKQPGGITEAEAIVSNAKKHMLDAPTETDVKETIAEEDAGAEPGPELNPEAPLKAQRNSTASR